MEELWTIKLSNYMGEDDTIYFENYEIAKKNFDYLRDMNKDMSEFEVVETKHSGANMSWFDPNYNEYSTYVDLYEGGPKIYNEIVF